MTTRRTFIAIVLAVVMVMSAGCGGWGEDGPTTPEEETDGNGETQDGVDSADEDSETDSADSSDDQEGEDTDSSGETRETSDENAEEVNEDDTSAGESGGVSETDSANSDSESDTSTESDESTADEQETDPSDTGDDGEEGSSTDEGSTENDSSESDNSGDTDTEEPVYTLTVEADAPITLERNWEDASTTRKPTDGTVEFSVIEGEYTLSADGYEDEVVNIEDDQTATLAAEESPTRTLDVSVIDGETNEGIEGATVELVESGSPTADPASYSVTTDSNGEAQEEVKDVSYAVIVHAEGYEEGHTEISLEESVIIPMKPAEDEKVHTLTVETQADVPVTLERFSDGATTERTATEGTVEFDVVEDVYGLSAEGHATIDPEVGVEVTDNTSVEMQSTDGESIGITVIDSETGNPIEGAEISGVCDWWYSSGDTYITGETNSEGVAQAESALTPTSCDTTVEAEGYEGASIPIAVPDDDGITVELDPVENGDNNA